LISPLPSRGRPSGAHHSADQLRPYRDLDDPARGADLVALLDVLERTHDDRADSVLLQVQGHPEHVPGELDQLTSHGSSQSVDLRNTVADADDPADIRRHHLGVEILQAALDY